MTAIETYYLGPTDKRGSRIKARATTGQSITLDWEDARSPGHNHGAAAKKLINKMSWQHHTWFGADGPKGSHLFVCALSNDALTFSSEQQDWAELSPRLEVK